MSHTDRDYDKLGGRSGGGFREAFGRIFGDAENPMGWSLGAGTVAGIRIKIHLLFIIYAIAQILWSIPKGNIGVGYTAIAMGVLFGLVLLHEFGHCFACRALKGEADEVMLWPLGGLASTAPPFNWRANVITTAGGPAVNLALLPVTSLALQFAGRPDLIVFNPFSPGLALGTLSSWGMVTLWFVHYLNALLLAFNVLVPMYPMDGGRLVQGALWARLGYRRATEITIVLGFAAAGVLAVIGLVGQQTLLFGIAVMGGLVCYRERQVLRAESDLAFAPYGSGAGAIDDAEEAIAERERRRAEKDRQKDMQEQAELDRILAKIAATGMDSLTAGERRSLKRATERRRRG